MTYTLSITTKQIYGDTNPPIPDGYRVKSFRPPTTGELILAIRGDYAEALTVTKAHYNFASHEPRIILKRDSPLDAKASHVAKRRFDRYAELGAVAA